MKSRIEASFLQLKRGGGKWGLGVHRILRRFFSEGKQGGKAQVNLLSLSI